MVKTIEVQFDDGYQATVPLAAGMTRAILETAKVVPGTRVVVVWYQVDGVGVAGMLHLDAWPRWELHSPIDREEWSQNAAAAFVDARQYLALTPSH